jgi:putative transposase
MIVGMRTLKQAARVAELIRDVQLAGKRGRDGMTPPSRYVDVGADFEVHRPAVESVSALFDLYNGNAASYAATGLPGEALPSG